MVSKKIRSKILMRRMHLITLSVMSLPSWYMHMVCDNALRGIWFYAMGTFWSIFITPLFFQTSIQKSLMLFFLLSKRHKDFTAHSKVSLLVCNLLPDKKVLLKLAAWYEYSQDNISTLGKVQNMNSFTIQILRVNKDIAYRYCTSIEGGRFVDFLTERNKTWQYQWCITLVALLDKNTVRS